MKSKDLDFRTPVDKECFRCNSCDGVVPNTTGGWNEVEPGLAFKVCDDCYKPKKDPNPKGKSELKEPHANDEEVGEAPAEVQEGE